MYPGYLQKVMRKNLGTGCKIKLFFVGILKFTDEKSRIRIRKCVVWIRGSESISKCHESRIPLWMHPHHESGFDIDD
jgi:hypothetical protein